MNKNKFFLWGAFSSLITILFTIIVLTFLSLTYTNETFSINEIFTSIWYLWFISAYVVLCQNIYFGVLQILNPGKEKKVYVGYLTIFSSFLVFPFFVSLEFFNRSGLNKKQIDQGIRRWIINNFSTFFKEIKNKNEVKEVLLDGKFKSLNKLVKIKSSSQFEVNDYKLDLLEKVFPQEKWPSVWNEQEILSYYGKN